MMRETSATTIPRARSIALDAVVVLALLGSLASAMPANAQGGQLVGLDGGSISAEQLASGNKIVIFFASWSPKCRDIAQRTAAISRRWNGRADVILVDFQEDAATVKRFLGDSRPVPVYLDRDGSFSKRHRVLDLPGLLVFRNGEAVYHDRLPPDPDSVLSRHF